ncbi:membrane protein [Candidatus Methylomirabilis lanthanidiphila]|uniref:Membrane protein n=1 Tax=Candidatus Methylomirabilis lanthanidiphila TaxID=2211376 RepID=A0A564ZIX0_9BACT|nr:VTT domain-containing protein [Candidatus Methylomirabilis lanthanidiphila]VUZ85300.1 membrane protein [Candidatus Methylomirabilis lanthanidiphila]
MEWLWDLFHTIYDVEGLVRVGGLMALIVIVFAETGLLIGFFLPGDSLLVTAGLFAVSGHLELWSLFLFVSLAAIVGDAVGYFIGVRSGPRIFSKEDSLLFHKKHLITTQEFYDRHGGITIVLARFMPILRTFAPVVAGVGNMQYSRFALYNVMGGVGWVVSMTSIGYFLGKTIPDIDRYIHVVIVAVILLSLVPGIVAFVRTSRRARKLST